MENLYTGFNETNTSQKIRISLSQKAMLTIEDDMTAFEVPKLTTFINQVISIFWDIAESSIDNYLSRKELELKERLSDSSIDSILLNKPYKFCLNMKRNNLSIKQLPIQLQGSAMKQTFHLTKDEKIAIEKSLMTARRHIYLAQIKELSSN